MKLVAALLLLATALPAPAQEVVRAVGGKDPVRHDREPAPAIDRDARIVLHEWGVVAGVAGAGFAITDSGAAADLPAFMTPLRGSSSGMAVAKQPVLHLYSDRPTGFSLRVGVPRGWPVVADPRPSTWNAWSDGPNSKQDRHVAWQGAIAPGATTSGPAVPAGHWLEKIRSVDASTLKVSGRAEKYLFYEAALPLAHPVSLSVRDGAVAASGPLPANAVAIRVRGGRAEQTGGADLATRLEATGLTASERAALLGIWGPELLQRDGLRLVTVLTGAEVDALLPIDCCPRPVETVRVLVVSVDFATPELEAKVGAIAERFDSDDLAARDDASAELAALGPLAREPIARLAALSDGEKAERLAGALDRIRASGIAPPAAPAPKRFD